MLRPAQLGLCGAAAPLNARCHKLRYKLRLFRALRAHEAISCLNSANGQQVGKCPSCARVASTHALHAWMVLQNLNIELHSMPPSEHTQCNHTCNPSRQCGWESLTTCQLSRDKAWTRLTVFDTQLFCTAKNHGRLVGRPQPRRTRSTEGLNYGRDSGVWVPTPRVKLQRHTPCSLPSALPVANWNHSYIQTDRWRFGREPYKAGNLSLANTLHLPVGCCLLMLAHPFALCTVTDSKHPGGRVWCIV